MIDDWRPAAIRRCIEGRLVRFPVQWHLQQCASKQSHTFRMEGLDRAAMARRRLRKLLRQTPVTDWRQRKALAEIGLTPGGYEMARTKS